jgi:alpha-L-arabinofuranosidase
MVRGCIATVLLLGSIADMSGASRATLEVSAERLSFYVKQDGSTPNADLFKRVQLTNRGTGTLNWTIYPYQPWIVADRRVGSLAAGETTSVAVGADITQAQAGPQTGTLSIWDADAIELIGTITVFLRVCAGVCVSADVGTLTRTIPPAMFGDQIDWVNSGNGLWDRWSTPSCADPLAVGGSVPASFMNHLPNMGLRVLRYPAGIPADFFHWSEATGHVATRTPQIIPWSSNAFAQTRACPVFGPDEFSQLAGQLGTEMLTVANAGTGTAQEAAGWLTYYKQRGITARYWEVGNEVYIPGYPIEAPVFPWHFAAAYLAPDRYASAFDQYATALRAVDPAVKIGAIANAYVSDWDEETFARIQQRADFVATHLLYPLACTTFHTPDQAYRLLLAAPTVMAHQLEQLKQVLAKVAIGANKQADIAITEHGAFFWCLDFDRNRTLASALYSALSFNLFFRDPRVVMAVHSNVAHPYFQAPLQTTLFGTALPSAYYHVFRAYAQAVGGRVTGASVLGAPTFATDGLGVFPPLSDLPVLDTVSVLAPDNQTLRVYVVNRSLSEDVTARVALDGFPGAIGSITVAVINGPNFESENSIFTPEAVSMTTRPLTAASEFEFTFPAHSLVVFGVQRQ